MTHLKLGTHPDTANTNDILFIRVPQHHKHVSTATATLQHKDIKSLVLNDKAVCFFVLSWYMFLKNVSAIQLNILKLLTSEQSNHKKEFFLPEVGSSNRNSTHKQLLKSHRD